MIDLLKEAAWAIRTLCDSHQPDGIPLAASERDRVRAVIEQIDLTMMRQQWGYVPHNMSAFNEGTPVQRCMACDLTRREIEALKADPRYTGCDAQ